MIQLDFSDEEIQALHQERLSDPHPRVRRRLEALYFKSQPRPHHASGRLLDITKPPWVGDVRTAQQGGIESRKAGQCHRPQRALAPDATRIAPALQPHPPPTLAAARERLSPLSGVSRSPAQGGQLLKQRGRQRRTRGVLPAQAMTDQPRRLQAGFREPPLAPRLAAANAAQRAGLFVDAAHCGYGPFRTGVCRVVRLGLPPPAGRQRVNS